MNKTKPAPLQSQKTKAALHKGDTTTSIQGLEEDTIRASTDDAEDEQVDKTWLSKNQEACFEGVLKKKSETKLLGKHVWNARYFMIIKDTGYLVYFPTRKEAHTWLKSPNKDDPPSLIALDRIMEIRKYGERKKRFDIVMESKSHIFEFETVNEKEYHAWLNAIEQYPKGKLKPLEVETNGGGGGDKLSPPRFSPSPLPSPHNSPKGGPPHLGAPADPRHALMPSASVPVLSLNPKDKYWKDPTATKLMDNTSYFKRTAFEVRMKSHQLRTFASYFTLVDYPAGASLFTKEEIGCPFYLVVEGEVRLWTVEIANHPAVFISAHGPTSTIGVSTLVDGKRLAEARAEKGCRVVELRSTDLEAYFQAESDEECKKFVRVVMGNDLVDLLSKVALLKKIPPRQLRYVGALARFCALDPNHVLFREGSLGASLYIVLKGQVKAFSAGGEGKQEKVLSFFNQNEVFGEISLLMAIPRTASIIATEPALLLELKKDDFSRVMEILPKRCKTDLQKVVKTRTAEQFRKYKVPFFEAIPEDKYEILADLCVLETFPSGTVLFKEGEIGASFYLIVHGHCAVSVLKPDEKGVKKDTQVAVMGPGKYFGEIALVQDSPRTATVTCVSRCVILSITSENFSKFFKEAPEAISDFEVKLARRDVQLRSVLYYPLGLTYFERFLKEEFSEENIDFWKECRAYRHMHEHAVLKYKEELLMESDSDNDDDDDSTPQNINHNPSPSPTSTSTTTTTTTTTHHHHHHHHHDHPDSEEEKEKEKEKHSSQQQQQQQQQKKNNKKSEEEIKEELAKLRKTDEYARIIGKLRSIYDTYVSPTASRQVNVNGTTAAALLQHIQSGDIGDHSLDPCVDEIQKLMASDSFSRFKATPLFDEFLKNAQTYQHVEKVPEGNREGKLRSGSIGKEGGRRSTIIGEAGVAPNRRQTRLGSGIKTGGKDNSRESAIIALPRHLEANEEDEDDEEKD